MGWDAAHHWTKKAIVVQDILREYGDKVVAHKSTKEGLWTILNVTHYETRAPIRVIVLDLLEKKDGMYWRKSLCESEGPTETNCPIEFLAMAPCQAGGYAEAWRARVVAAQEQAAKTRQVKASVGIGSKVTLSNGWELTVTSLRPFIGTDSSGKPWRIPARMLVGA